MACAQPRPARRSCALLTFRHHCCPEKDGCSTSKARGPAHPSCKMSCHNAHRARDSSQQQCTPATFGAHNTKATHMGMCAPFQSVVKHHNKSERRSKTRNVFGLPAQRGASSLQTLLVPTGSQVMWAMTIATRRWLAAQQTWQVPGRVPYVGFCSDTHTTQCSTKLQMTNPAPSHRQH